MPVVKEQAEIQQNAVGYEIVIRTNSVMDNTTDLLLIIKNDYTKKIRKLTRENVSNPANGEVTYKFLTEDLDEPGNYYIQVIDVTNGVFIPSEIGQFKVVENI